MIALNRKRFVLVFLCALVLEAAAFSAIFIPRPPLKAKDWAFLERQRPSKENGIFVCFDCLNFAVFRRGFGAWEPVSAHALLLVNLPAFAASHQYFVTAQRQPGGSSQEHSDRASVVLVAVTIIQCGLLALLLSLRRKPSGRAPKP